MTFGQHVASAGIGAVAGLGAVESGVPELPQTKAQLISLLSAVLVQGLIFGISKIGAWLRKKETPTTPAA